MSPAMQRSRVLLPEPDLPSSATISPSWSSKSMPSSTTSGWPSGVVKFLVTRSTAMIVSPAPPSAVALGWCWWESWSSPRGARSERVLGLGEVVEAPPEEPVDQHDEEAHDRDAEEHLGEVADGWWPARCRRRDRWR